jgi:hypothetical protein
MKSNEPPPLQLSLTCVTQIVIDLSKLEDLTVQKFNWPVRSAKQNIDYIHLPASSLRIYDCSTQ